MSDGALAFRPAEERDMGLVLDSWVDSYRTSHAAGMIPMPLYRKTYLDAVRWVLKRPGVSVTVAYKPGEDVGSDLYGWIAVEHGAMGVVSARKRVDGRMQWVEELEPINCPYVLYAYVRDPYRRMGVGRALFEAAGVNLAERFLYACKTGVVTQLQRQAPLASWSPLIVRYPKQNNP